jgi:hypothetical protein
MVTKAAKNDRSVHLIMLCALVSPFKHTLSTYTYPLAIRSQGTALPRHRIITYNIRNHRKAYFLELHKYIKNHSFCPLHLC